LPEPVGVRHTASKGIAAGTEQRHYFSFAERLSTGRPIEHRCQRTAGKRRPRPGLDGRLGSGSGHPVIERANPSASIGAKHGRTQRRIEQRSGSRA